MIYRFKKDPESGMIMVYVLLDGNRDFKMALDTGATRTTFDINPLYMADYPVVKNVIETGMVETANGIVDVGIIKVDSLSAFGHTIPDMKVQVYDFLSHGIISDYDGVLGLDFFENTVFTIDMEEQTIEVKSKKASDSPNSFF